MEERDVNRIGQIVKARTLSLQLPSSALARRGLRELGRLTTDSELLQLVKVVRDGESWQVRSDAWARLRKIGPNRKGWEAALKDLIYSSDGWGRIFAAESLAWHSCAPEDAVPVLIATLDITLENHFYDWARLACGAIGRYKQLDPLLKEQSIQSLMNALDCSDDNVFAYAAETLSGFGYDALAAIPKIVAAARLKKPWLKDFLGAVLKRYNPSVEDAVDALFLALASPDSRIRGEAVSEIGSLQEKGRKAIPQLLLLVKDEVVDIRRLLAFSLGKIGTLNDKVLDVLCSLSRDEDQSVCLAAAYGFLKLGVNEEPSHELLRNSLRSAEEFVRFLASWALGEVGAYNANLSVSVLEEVLQTEPSERVIKNIETSLKALKPVKS